MAFNNLGLFTFLYLNFAREIDMQNCYLLLNEILQNADYDYFAMRMHISINLKRLKGDIDDMGHISTKVYNNQWPILFLLTSVNIFSFTSNT